MWLKIWEPKLPSGWISAQGLKDEKGLDNIMGIVDQLTAFMGMKSYENNKAMVDLYMNPDLKGFTAASFTAEAIDTMIQRGERVARANWDKIMALKKQIGLEPDEDAAPPSRKQVFGNRHSYYRKNFYRRSEGKR